MRNLSSTDAKLGEARLRRLRELTLNVGGVRIGGLLAAGQTEGDLLAAYPCLEPADVQAALAYVAWRTQETELPLP